MGFDPEASSRRALVKPSAMAKADQRTIAAGTSRGTLIARAARACFRILRAEFLRQPVVVLCGPGQNGEDGLVLASLLSEAGWPLTIMFLDGEIDVRGTQKDSLARCVRPTGTFQPKNGILVVDAMFGAGLNRKVEGEAAALIDRLNGSGAKVLSIDLPSGIDGATGDVLGTAVRADATVTFHRLKPGHLIGAGRDHAGEVFLADIGIEGVGADACALHNHPSLWKHLLFVGARDTHKYKRGHTLVVGGPGLRGGAARLSARGASVSGAGAVTYLAPLSGAEFAASSFDAVMVKPLRGPESLKELIREHGTSIVIGPGMGHGRLAEDCLSAALEMQVPVVLDADALTLYEETPDRLFDQLHEQCVLTPHEGEFRRLFGGIEGDKLTRVEKAAERAGATVLLKGATTVIAGTDLPVVNTNGAAVLATAGSGDVLAGVIGGFLAQGLGAMEAASAGAWIHAEAGAGAAPSLNADQLPARIAKVIEAITQ